MSTASLSLHLYSSVPDTEHSSRNILVRVVYSVFVDVTARRERSTEMSNTQRSRLSKAANWTLLRRLGTQFFSAEVSLGACAQLFQDKVRSDIFRHFQFDHVSTLVLHRRGRAVHLTIHGDTNTSLKNTIKSLSASPFAYTCDDTCFVYISPFLPPWTPCDLIQRYKWTLLTKLKMFFLTFPYCLSSIYFLNFYAKKSNNLKITKAMYNGKKWEEREREIPALCILPSLSRFPFCCKMNHLTLNRGRGDLIPYKVSC